MTEYTTIRVSKETANALKEKKLTKGELIEEIIKRLLYGTNNKGTDMD